MTTTVGSDKLAPVHLGDVHMADFLEGFGTAQNKLAVAVGVPPLRISEFVHGNRGNSADTALRLGKYFGTSAQFWRRPQTPYGLDLADDRAADQTDAITPLQVA